MHCIQIRSSERFEKIASKHSIRIAKAGSDVILNASVVSLVTKDLTKSCTTFNCACIKAIPVNCFPCRAANAMWRTPTLNP